MDKKKKIGIMLIVMMIILVIILFVIIKIKGSENMEEDLSIQSAGNPDDEYVNKFDTELKLVQSRNDFYIVKNILENYYMYLSEISDPAREIEIYETEDEFDIEKYLEEIKESNIEIVYSFLSNDYINEFDVTKKNLLEKLGEYGKISLIIDEMYVAESSTSIATYFVYGLIKDNDTLEILPTTVMVTLDLQSRTFSISPYEYMQKKGYDKTEVGETFKINLETIEEKTYNTYDYKTIADEKVLLDYIELYKTRVLYDTQRGYDTLDKEYGEKRFGNIENYNKYVQENLDRITNISINSYSVEELEKGKKYICIDQNGKYYIINETGIMQFSVILDTYTLELPEFIEKYESTNEQGKVALNIQKFMDSISARDYQYGYSKLGEAFKQNNFSTIESYENYINRTFYRENEVDYVSFKEEAGLYTYTIRVSNKEDSEADIIEKTMIVQLQEGTEFMLSFNL